MTISKEHIATKESLRFIPRELGIIVVLLRSVGIDQLHLQIAQDSLAVSSFDVLLCDLI